MAGIVFTKGSGLNDSVFGKSLFPIRALLESKAEAYEAQSTLKNIFVMEKSTNFGEKVTGMTSMNGFSPVAEGGASPIDEFQEGYGQTFEHVEWKDSFAITKAAMDDNKILDLRTRPGAFIKGYHRVRETFGNQLIAAGAAASQTAKAAASLTFRGMSFSANSADGVSLFSKFHPSKTGNTAVQSNIYAAPTSGSVFTASVLGKAETAMQNFKDDNGNPLAVTPDTIIIQNNAEMKEAVFAAIGADKDPATANNGFNYQFGRWNVIVNPYWTTASGKEWILMSRSYNEDALGAVWFDRTPLIVRTDFDDNTWNTKFSGYARWSAGFNDWRFAAMFGVSGATAL